MLPKRSASLKKIDDGQSHKKKDPIPDPAYDFPMKDISLKMH